VLLFINVFNKKYAACFVVAALEVDGKPMSAGSACTAACGSAVSLVCTVNNCTSCLLTDLTVELLAVDTIQSCASIPVKSDATDRRAVFDSSAVAIGCLMSVFPQVRLTEHIALNAILYFLACRHILFITAYLFHCWSPD